MSDTLEAMSPGIPTRLVQLTHPDEGRRAAVVYGNELHLLATYRSIYSFALAAVETGWKLRDLLSTDLSGIVLDYEEIYALATPWRFLPCFDHPDEPARCLVSAAGSGSELRDTWSYKGSGTSLVGHGELLAAPGLSGAAGGLAGVYVIGSGGAPRRVGITLGHCARSIAIGPELVVDATLPKLDGMTKVMRAGREIAAWPISGGGVPLPLALAAIEPDHFQCAGHRRPGDAHIHFFGERLFGEHLLGEHSSGAQSFSSRPPLAVEEGDEVEIRIEDLGKPLRNPIQLEQLVRHRVAAVPL
jgi:hypothetical protein